MRWVSPPESDVGAAAQREILEPDVAQEPEPVAHFLEDRARRSRDRAPAGRCDRSGTLSKNSSARSTGSSTTSPMLRPFTSTARLSALSRLPPQVWQGCSIMNSSSVDPDRVAGGLAVAPLDVPEHAFPLALVLAAAARALGLELEPARRAVEQRLLGRRRCARPRAR